MKFLCTVLILGLSPMAYAQSPGQQPAESPAPGQPSTQSRPVHQTNTPPAQQQSAEPSAAPGLSNAQSQTPDQSKAPPAPQQPVTLTSSPGPTSHPPAKFYRWELSGGYAHISGNQGLDGFNVGASGFLAPNVSLGFNFDGVYDTTILGSGAFALTNVGLVTTKSHLYDYMAGPRIYFPGVLKPCRINALPVLRPFVQAQFGESTLWTQVTSVNVGTVATQDTAFSWLLGGGGEFRIDDHFAARVSADFLRTHIADSGQSRIRVILGVVGRF